MEDTLFLGFFGLYGFLLVLDVVSPARAFHRVRWWRARGIAGLALYLVLASMLPLVWDAWLGEHRLIDATGLGVAGGAIVGLLAVQLGSYLWHRALHGNDFLWRWFHQVHHSAERVDLPGAFYFSPLDIAGFTLAGSLSLVLVVGVSGPAAAIAGTISLALATFNHANVRTPRWLGYIIQRPENHAVHHERGVHAYNYGDIALWDQVFGTWKNPARWDGEGGFFDGSSNRLGAMLLGRDVAAQPGDRAAR